MVPFSLPGYPLLFEMQGVMERVKVNDQGLVRKRGQGRGTFSVLDLQKILRSPFIDASAADAWLLSSAMNGYDCQPVLMLVGSVPCAA